MMGPEYGELSQGSDTSTTSGVSQIVIHWCPKNEEAFDHVIFFNKFSAGQLGEPVPDELLCLNKCWKCVQEYYHSRKKYLERPMSHSEGVLYTFECIVLRHFLNSLSQNLRQNKEINEPKNSVKSPLKEQTKSLPIVVKQILQYPFFLFMREIHDAFIEVLVELLKEQINHYNVSKFPGLYVLLIHPNRTVHTWAKEVVKNFCPIELGDSSDLLRAANLVLSVLKFNLQTDPILCDNLAMEEPSCRIIIMSHLFSMDVYWHGLQTLLNHMDGDLVRKVHPEIPQTILDSLLEAAASIDPERDDFLRKLSCFVVVLKSLKEDIWSQVEHSREKVFISVIKCKAWSGVLERICRDINAPNSLSLVFNWITHWASSLGGSQSSCYIHTQYCAIYAYHILSLVQHRLFHLQPKVEKYSSCRGPSECKFCQFKHRVRNKLTIDLDIPFLRNVESLTTLMRITRNLLREKFTLGDSSSKGVAIPRRMKPSHAGFLTYSEIVKLISLEQRNKLGTFSVSEGSSDSNQSNSNIQSSQNSVTDSKTASKETHCNGETEVQRPSNLSETEQSSRHHSKEQSNITMSTPSKVQTQSRPISNLSKKSRLSLSRQDGDRSRSDRKNSSTADTPHTAGEDSCAEKQSKDLNSSSRNLMLMLKKINRGKREDVSTTEGKTPRSKSSAGTAGGDDSKEPTSGASTPVSLERPHHDTVRLDRKGRVSSQDARRLKLRKCFISINHVTLKTQETEESPTCSEEYEEVRPPRKKARPLSSDSEMSDCEMDTPVPVVQTQAVSKEATPPGGIRRQKPVVESDDETDMEMADEDSRVESEKHEETDSRGLNRRDSRSDSDLPDVFLDREDQSISEQSNSEKSVVLKSAKVVLSRGGIRPFIKDTERSKNKPQKEKSAQRKKNEPEGKVIKQQRLRRELFGKGQELAQGTGEVGQACNESSGNAKGKDGNATGVVEGAIKVKQEKLEGTLMEDNDILEVKVIDEPACFVISSDEEDNEKREEDKEDRDKMEHRKESKHDKVEPPLAILANTVPTSEGSRMSSSNTQNSQSSKRATTALPTALPGAAQESTSMEEGTAPSSEQCKVPQSSAHKQSAKIALERKVNILSRKSHQSFQTKGKCKASDCNACKNHGGKHGVHTPERNTGRRKRKMVHEVRSDDDEDDSVFLEDGGKEGKVIELSDNDIQGNEPNGILMEEEGEDWEITEEEKGLPKVRRNLNWAGGEERSSVDSDAETDDGTGTAGKREESSLDFLDEVLMKDDVTKQQSKIDDDDDGDSSDGLELSEIIDHTESFFTDLKDVYDNAKSIKNDGQGNGWLEDESNRLWSDEEVDKSTTDAAEAEMMDDEGGEENVVIKEKGNELLMDILNGVGTSDQEEEDDDDEDGDGWLEDEVEGDDEMEDGGQKDNGGWLSDDSEESIEPSQGFQVSGERVEVRDMRRRVLTGGSSETCVDERDTDMERKKQLDSGIPGETEEEGHKTGIQSKSFYKKRKVARGSKKPQKMKAPPFNGYHAHARMKNMQRKLSLHQEMAKNAVPLGHKSLVTGQRLDAKKPSTQQGNIQGEATEDNQQKEVTSEVRLAPTVKSSSHRSKRSESFLESLKQAEGHRDGRVRLAHTRTLSSSSSSHVPLKKAVSDPAGLQLSSSFTAGVPIRSRPTGGKDDTKGGTKDGDILTSIMNASTKTHQIDARPRNNRPLSRTPSSPAESRIDSSSSSHHAETGDRDNPKRRVQFDLSGPGDLSSTVSPHRNASGSGRGILKSHPSTSSVSSNLNGDQQRSTTRGTSDAGSRLQPTVQKHRSRQQATPVFGSPEKKAANMTASTEMTCDQFLGWILSWDVNSLADYRTNSSSILKGCDYKTLREVPTSFASVDEFYEVFLPLKMIQIWNRVQFAYKKVRSDQLPTGLLVETHHYETYTLCRFTVSMATNVDGSPSTMQYPKKLDLVTLRQDDSDDLRPILGFICDSTPYSTPEFYSNSSEKGLRVWIRLRPKVNVKGTNFKIQVITSLSSYINQFTAFLMFPKNFLASSILSPTRKDVFCVNDTPPPLSHNIYKKTYQNDEQEDFLKSAFNCIQESYAVPRICMLQGPPCSGKTRTLATLIACLLKHSSLVSDSSGVKPKILVCAPSDCALDVLVSNLWKVLRKDNPTERTDSRPNTPANLNYFILRIGEEKCVEHKLRQFAMEKIVKDQKAKHDNLLKQRRKFIGELDMKEQALDASIQYNKTIPKKQSSVEKLKKEKMEVRQRRKEEEDRLDREIAIEFSPNKTRDELILVSDVVCCKIQDVSSPILQTLIRKPAGDPWKITFSCAIIDEACQCLEVDTILPLYSTITKLVLAGDSHELKHKNFPQIPSRFKLNQSLFTRLCLNFQGSLCCPVRMLREQHWCHPEIFSFPNRIFYNNRMKTSEACSQKFRKQPDVKLMPYLVFDLRNSSEKAVSESEWINEAELDLVQNIVRIIHGQGYERMNVAILSPYKEQTRLLRQRMADYPGLYIGDVEGLQGKMKEIVIISCVRTQRSSHRLSFLDNLNKLNIALTRAAFSTFVIGNFAVLPHIHALWANLFQDAMRRDLYVTVCKEYTRKMSDKCLRNKFQRYQDIRMQRREIANPRRGEKMVEPSPS